MAICSVFTDASFDDRFEVGGWAAWIKHDGRKYEAGGPLRTPILDSSYAELAAAANGIITAVRIFDPGHVHLVTDCDHVIRALRHGGTCRAGDEVVVKAVRQALHCRRLTIKHVKAHSGAPTPRQWVNAWCDAQARRHMRTQRKKVSQCHAN